MKTTKRFKLLMGSITALLGGVLLASAAVVDVVSSYTINAILTNGTTVLVSVDGVPAPATTDIEPGNFGVVWTDGSGKVDGVWDLSVTNLSDMGAFTEGIFIADVSGSVKSSGKTPVSAVSMSVKGNGYVQDATGTAVSGATMNFTFNGKLASKSSGVATPLGANIILAQAFDSGPFTTNQFVSFGPQSVTTNTTTGYTNRTGLSSLSFLINTSDNQSTNTVLDPGTNIVQQVNDAFFDTGDISPVGNYNFGPPIDSNVIGSPLTLIYTNAGSTNATTNIFNWYPIGTNVTFEVINGFTNAQSTNVVSGLADTNVAAFITAYIASQSVSNGSTTEIIRQILTNVTAGGSGSFSNQVVNTPNLFSNSWYEVDGTLKGSINAKKAKHSLNSEAATLSQAHILYSQGGSYSNNNVNGVLILEQHITGNNATFNPFDALSAKVVSVNKSLWLSSREESFSGKGTLNSKKSTYSANLRGVARSRGSSGKITGGTGVLIFGAGTNVVTLDNIAALPIVSINYTNTSGVTQFPFLQNNITNMVTSTNRIDAHNTWENLPVAGTTNAVPNGIKTVTFSGKVQGQTVPPASGINPDFQD